MASSRHRRLVALVLALMLVVPLVIALVTVANPNRPSSAEPSDRPSAANPACRTAPGYVTGAVQRYVDRFAARTGFEGRNLPAPPRVAELRREFDQVRRQVESAGCDLTAFRSSLRTSLANVRADGPLATAVSGLLRSASLRALGGAPAPAVATLGAGEDLAAAVAQAPLGGTLRLAAGTYTLDQPLYVLQDLTLQGAGRGRTTVVSTAAGGGIVMPLPAQLRLDRLALEHRGAASASVLMVWAGRATLAAVQVSGGSTPTPAGDRAQALGGGAGSGVLVARDGSVRMRGVALDDNDVAGLLAGDHATVDVRGSSFADNGLCGICATGQSRGLVQGSTLSGSPVGVYVGQRARPTLRANMVRDNGEVGIAVQEAARPVIVGNEVSDSDAIGIGVYATSRPRIVDNTVTGSGKAGLVLSTGSSARAHVERNRLADNASGDIVVAGQGRHDLRGNHCSSALQLLLVDGASPTLSGNACEVRRVAR